MELSKEFLGRLEGRVKGDVGCFYLHILHTGGKGDPHSEMAPNLAALVQVLLKVTLTSNKIRYLVE